MLLVHHSVILRTRPRTSGASAPPILARAADAMNWDKPNQRFEVQLSDRQERPSGSPASNVQASGLLEWGTSDPENRNSPPAASHVYTVIMRILKPKIEGPIIYSGSVSTNNKIKQLNSKIDLRAAAGVEPLRQIYRLTPEERIGQQGVTGSFPTSARPASCLKTILASTSSWHRQRGSMPLYPSIKVVGGGAIGRRDPHSGRVQCSLLSGSSWPWRWWLRHRA